MSAGSPRRFRAYNVGIPKTGTSSMAGIFSRYRTAHEFLYEETARTLVAHRRGEIDRTGLRDFVLWRDEQGCLEMDSASFSSGYADVLAETFPGARFILTMRDCYSWLDSLLNMLLVIAPLMPEWMIEYGRLVLGIPFTPEMARSKETFVAYLPEIVDSCLAYWSRANAALLTSLPPHRTLLLRTREISASTDAIAGFVGVPAPTLTGERSHLFKVVQRFHLLHQVDAVWLQATVDSHCGSLMERYFPECTLERFLGRDRIDDVAPPPAPLKPKRKMAGARHVDDGSFAAHVELIRPYVPPELVSDQAMAEIIDLTAPFPGRLALETYGFECNLSKPEPAADFAFVIQSGREGRTLVRALPTTIQEHRAWGPVRGFLEAWADPESALSSALDNAWLEFDLAGREEGMAISSRVPSVSHSYGSTETIRKKGLSVERRVDVSHRALEILTGRAVEPAVLDRLRSCFERLPPGAEVFQVGAMRSRQTDVVRVRVRGLDPPQIPSYLDQLGWTGERGRLAWVLQGIEARASHLGLVLDLGETVHPELGFECFLDPDGTPPRERWEPLVAFLKREGLVLEPKAEALLSYPGHLDERREGDRWPSSLRQVSDLAGPTTVSVFLLSIHHVKLVLEPEQPLQAGAYLTVRHFWVSVG